MVAATLVKNLAMSVHVEAGREIQSTIEATLRACDDGLTGIQNALRTLEQSQRGFFCLADCKAFR